MTKKNLLLLTAQLVFLIFLMPLPVGAEEKAFKNHKLNDWLESWRLAWEKGDIEQYISFYADLAIQDGRKGKKSILSYRRRLWPKSPPQHISINLLQTCRQRRGSLLVFEQKYVSSGFADEGYKTMLVEPAPESEKKWLIRAENWHRTLPKVCSAGAEKDGGDNGSLSVPAPKSAGDAFDSDRLLNLESWLESWRRAWETADLESYLSFYRQKAIQETRKNVGEIRRQRKALWKMAKPASVKISDLEIYKHPRGLMLCFAQDYSARNVFSDSGFKTLLIIASDAGEEKWQIAEERWYRQKPDIPYPLIGAGKKQTQNVQAFKKEEQMKIEQWGDQGQKKAAPEVVSEPKEKEIVFPEARETQTPIAVVETITPSPDKEKLKKTYSPAAGGGYTIIPQIKVIQAYNDNLYWSSGERKGDWVSAISPAIELARKSEILAASISARLSSVNYLNQHELNAVEQFYLGKLRKDVTSRLTIGADAGYVRDAQANRDIDVTGAIFPVPVNRESYNLSAYGEWWATERGQASFLYKYQGDRYDRDNYVDLCSQVAAAGLSYQLNSVTRGRINLSWANYRVAGAKVDAYWGTFGFSRDVSSMLNVLVDVGAILSRSSFAVPFLIATPAGITLATRQEDSAVWGPFGQIVISYKQEKTNASFSVRRSVMPVSGTISTANRTYFGLECRRRFTNELTGVLAANYFINKSDRGEFSAAMIDQSTMYVSLGSRYDVNKDLFVMASYNYNRFDNGQTRTSADQHLFLVTLNIQHAILQ